MRRFIRSFSAGLDHLGGRCVHYMDRYWMRPWQLLIAFKAARCVQQVSCLLSHGARAVERSLISPGNNPRDKLPGLSRGQAPGQCRR